jgi:hypothetical protein
MIARARSISAKVEERKFFATKRSRLTARILVFRAPPHLKARSPAHRRRVPAGRSSFRRETRQRGDDDSTRISDLETFNRVFRNELVNARLAKRDEFASLIDTACFVWDRLFSACCAEQTALEAFDPNNDLCQIFRR